MGTTLLQIRVDNSLKEEASKIFEEIGIDTPTAIRMFLKRSVIEKGIPFSVILPSDKNVKTQDIIDIEPVDKQQIFERLCREVHAISDLDYDEELSKYREGRYGG